MLQKQTIPLPLIRGIDKSSADQLRAPDALSEGLNVEQLKTGELSKRPGFDAKATVDSEPRALVPVNDSVAVIQKDGFVNLLRADETTVDDIPRYRPTGQVLSAFGESSAKIKDFLGNIEGVGNYEIHVHNDIVYVYVNGTGGADLYRFDENLNLIPYGSAAFKGVNLSSARFIGTTLISGSSGSRLYAYDITTGNLIKSNVVATAVNGNSAWEVCEGTSGRFIFVYRDATAIQIEVQDSSLSLVGSTSISSANWKLHALVPQVAESTFLLYMGRTNAAASANRVEIHRFNETPAQIASLTTSTTIQEPYNLCGIYGDSSDTWIYVEYDPNGGTGLTYERQVGAQRFDSQFAVNGTFVISDAIRRAGLASKPFFLDQTLGVFAKIPHIFLAYQSEDSNNLQNCVFLCRSDEFGNRRSPYFVVSQLQYGKSENLISTFTETKLPSVEPFSDGVFFAGLFNRINSQFALSAAAATFALVGCEITIDANYTGSKAASIAGNTIFASGGLYLADPLQITEYGFFLYPDPPSLAESTSGSLTATGTYAYVLVYEYYDSRGNLIESAPSEPATITLTSTNRTVTVTTKAVGWVNKRTMRVSLYRTVASGSTYYFVQSSTLFTSLSISFTDTQSDAAISDNRILYTTGGVVETIQPSNPCFVASAKNRLWTFERGSTDQLWFSTKPTDDFLARFSDLLIVTIPVAGGELVGVAQIDDKLIVFKERRIFALFGDGPTANLQGSFSEPQAIVQGMGCINARSIVETPAGVLYQAQEGIYLIDRSLQNVFLGRPLYKEEGTIVGSTYDPVLNRVFFASTTQIWVLYLTTQAWYEWTGTSPVDLLIEGGKLWQLKDNGNDTGDILAQGTNWQDDGANYEQKVRLGQFQFAGVQGYQRLYRLLLTGKNNGDADSSNLTVKVFNNANTTETDSDVIQHDSLIVDNRMELEIRPSKQRCESAEVQLSLTANTSGLTVAAVSAEVGGYQGAARRSETRRV